jgi:hypothetical protein
MAVLPGVLAAVILLSLRAVRRAVVGTQQAFTVMALPFRPAKRPRESSRKQILAATRLVDAIGRQLRALRAQEHTMIRVRAGAGATTVCRIASPPALIGLAVGDRVEIRGRRQSDGTLCVMEIRDRNTGVRHRPSFLPPRVFGYALVSAVLVALLLTSVAHLQAG